MKTINKISLIIALIAVIVLILGWSNMFGESSGYVVTLFGFPLLIIGIIIWIVGLFTKKK